MSAGFLKTTKTKITLALTMLFCCQLQLANATTMDEVIKKGELIVATEDDYAPFNFITGGKPDGFHKDILELLRAYAKEHGGFKIKQEILPWTGLLAAVSQGKYDVGLTGTVTSSQRIKALSFAAPIGSAQHFFVKRADDNSIKSFTDLSGKTVGVQSGSVFDTGLPALAKKIQEENGKLGKKLGYQSYPEAYSDLVNGRVDYVVNLEICINDAVKKQPKLAKGLAVPGMGYVAWPVSKRSPEILEYMTGFVKHITENGELAKLQEKWFGQSFKLPLDSITSLDQYEKLVAPSN